MNCPSDNDYALLLDGRLDTQDRRAIEKHIDACAECRALVAALGHAYAASTHETLPSLGAGPPETGGAREPVTPLCAVAVPEVDPVPSDTRRLLIALELIMVLVHLVWAGLFLPHVWRAVAMSTSPEQWAELLAALPGSDVNLPALAFASYSALWAPLGLLWTSASAYGFWRSRPWAPTASRIHLWVSLLSGFLAPLAVLTLVELDRAAGDRTPRRAARPRQHA